MQDRKEGGKKRKKKEREREREGKKEKKKKEYRNLVCNGEVLGLIRALLILLIFFVLVIVSERLKQKQKAIF